MILRLGLVVVLLVACDGSAATSRNTPALASPIDASAPGQATPAATPPGPGQSAPALVVPAALPVYPGARSVTPTDSWAIAAWTADAQPPNVHDYYVVELPAAGFVIDLDAPGGEVAIIRFSTSNGTSYQLDLTGVDPVLIELGAPHD